MIQTFREVTVSITKEVPGHSTGYGVIACIFTKNSFLSTFTPNNYFYVVFTVILPLVVFKSLYLNGLNESCRPLNVSFRSV